MPSDYAIARTSVRRGDPVCNPVVLCLRHDAPRHYFAGMAIGTSGNQAVCFCRSHARQAQQILFCGRVQIEWLVVAPALAYPCRDRLGIVFDLGRCLRGFLFQLLLGRCLIAGRQPSQQQPAQWSATAHFATVWTLSRA